MEPRKPFLIRMLALLAGVAAAVIVLFVVLAMVGVSGRYVINGDEVTRGEFLARGVPPLLLAALAASIVAWAFWKERRWARHAFVAAWLALLAWLGVFLWNDPDIDADEVFELVFGVALGAPVIWYFYLKRGVVMYYRELGRRAASRPA